MLSGQVLKAPPTCPQRDRDRITTPTNCEHGRGRSSSICSEHCSKRPILATRVTFSLTNKLSIEPERLPEPFNNRYQCLQQSHSRKFEPIWPFTWQTYKLEAIASRHAMFGQKEKETQKRQLSEPLRNNLAGQLTLILSQQLLTNLFNQFT